MRWRKTTAATPLLFLAAPAGAQDSRDVTKLAGVIRWGGLLFSIFTILEAMVVLRVVGDVSTHLSGRFANRRPTIQKVKSVVGFAICIVAVTFAIALSVKLDSTELAVIRGALAAAIGLSMRELVASFIAGITIVFDRPFQVGDRLTFAGQYGDVIKIALRSTRVNTLDHNNHHHSEQQDSHRRPFEW